MAYIGKQPSTKFSAAAKVDTFTGDGSTVAFDLANIIPAGGENGLQVFVNNIRQKPGASNAFTVGNDGSGDLKRITFTAAPDAADEIYVITTFEATNITEVGDGTIATAKIADGAVTTAKILDGTIANADINACAAIADSKLATISTAGKVNVSALSAPGSTSVFLRGDKSYAAIDVSGIDKNAFNISLLGFKMAVNEGLTVFNLVDGIVDEFHDESGTDEAEGSNDTYCASSDFYQNATFTPYSYSAGFALTSVTEADTSGTAPANPATGEMTFGKFTVPSGVTSVTGYAWGGGGSRGGYQTYANGGGGGFVSGNIAVTAGQVLNVAVAEGRAACESGRVAWGGKTPTNESGGGHGYSFGGGLSGITNNSVNSGAFNQGAPFVPAVLLIAGGGGGGGSHGKGGAGGGLTGDAGDTTSEQTNTGGGHTCGGGGDQEQGGQGGPYGAPNCGSLFTGGDGGCSGGGGAGYYGGAGGGYAAPAPGHGSGGGGSSYYGNPAITSGATEEGTSCEGGGTASPLYVADTNEGGTGGSHPSGANPVENGYVLITSAGCIASGAVATNIVSNAFTSTTVPTTSRIVVFQENVDSPTLNTDIIASVSRDGGSNFTTATLTDSGYVTGSSGQRILTGQATISGQPSGQSMRWKLALANNHVKIHGVSLQWA